MSEDYKQAKHKETPTQLTFYKANPSKTGAACSVSFNSLGSAVYVTLIKQVSWDDKSKKGSFSGGDKTVLKLSVSEVGAIIAAIRGKILAPWGKDGKTYHKNAKNYSYITFAPYEREGLFQGFGLSIQQGDNEDREKKAIYKIGFNLAEATLLEEYLVFALGHIFGAWYSTDKKARSERFEKEKQAPKVAPTNEENEPEQTQDDDEVIF